MGPRPPLFPCSICNQGVIPSHTSYRMLRCRPCNKAHLSTCSFLRADASITYTLAVPSTIYRRHHGTGAEAAARTLHTMVQATPQRLHTQPSSVRNISPLNKEAHDPIESYQRTVGRKHRPRRSNTASSYCCKQLATDHWRLLWLVIQTIIQTCVVTVNAWQSSTPRIIGLQKADAATRCQAQIINAQCLP